MTERSKVRAPSQERSKVTVEAILEAASQLLRTQGFRSCSTTAIAKRAGVSVGTLYQYFGKKEAVFDALLDRVLAQRTAARTEVLAAAPATLEIGPAILMLIDQLLALHAIDPALQHELHRYEASRGSARLEQYEDDLRDVVVAQLRLHAARFRPLQPELAARVVVHSLAGVVERMAREDPSQLARPEVRTEIAALLAGYLSPDNPVVGAERPAAAPPDPGP